jgi:hypothetical protein
MLRTVRVCDGRQYFGPEASVYSGWNVLNLDSLDLTSSLHLYLSLCVFSNDRIVPLLYEIVVHP